MKILKVDSEKRLVGGIVYSPNELDRQNDYSDAKEIWKGLESWAERGHPMNLMHEGRAGAFCVECFQAERPTYKGGGVIPAGAWYITAKIVNDELWKQIRRDHTWTGFSMAGKSKSVEKGEPDDPLCVPGFQLESTTEDDGEVLEVDQAEVDALIESAVAEAMSQ